MQIVSLVFIPSVPLIIKVLPLGYKTFRSWQTVSHLAVEAGQKMINNYDEEDELLS